MERFAIVDHGCKVNRYDGERVRAALVRYGLVCSDDASGADLLVLNACAVTDKAVRRGRQQLRAFRRGNAGARVLVTGCFTPEDRARYEELADDGVLIADARDRERLDEVLRDWLPAAVVARRGVDDPFGFAFEDRARAYLKVEDGCDAHCAFCVIPRIRGAVRSKSIGDAVAEARAALERGFAELVVCGIHLGHYGRDIGSDLPRLLDTLRDLPFDYRIRLGSLEVGEVGAALATRLGTDPRLAPHLHVPLQSGDDSVLRAMRRPYSAEIFRRRIEHLREVAPEVAFTTDVIVGFPGETEEAFERSCALVSQLGCTKVHVFPFSPRAGTEAATLPGRVPMNVLRQRVRRLIAIDARLRSADDRQSHGRRERVLIHEVIERQNEGSASSATIGQRAQYSRGLSGRHRVVFVEGVHPVASLATVKIGGSTPFHSEGLFGTPMENSTIEESKIEESVR